MSWEAVSHRLEIAKVRAAERDAKAERRKQEEDEDEESSPEAGEMYLDSDQDDETD